MAKVKDKTIDELVRDDSAAAKAELTRRRKDDPSVSVVIEDARFNVRSERRAEKANKRVREQQQKDEKVAAELAKSDDAPLEARAVALDRGVKVPELKSSRR